MTVFDVRKPDGSRWEIHYTSSGVKWLQLEDEPGASQREAGVPPRFPPGVRGGSFAVALAAMNVAVEGLRCWDEHQWRRLAEAQIEEERRIGWLIDMMQRWAVAHSLNGLDLKVTEYLCREAEGLMLAAGRNDKIQLPQALMFEIGRISDVLGGFRMMYHSQFEALAANNRDEFDAAIRTVLPGRRLNMSFVRELGEDPAAAWVAALQNKTTATFDQDLRDGTRDMATFLKRVFASTELAPVRDEAPAPKWFLEEAVNQFVKLLPRPAQSWVRISPERMDAFRELILLRAEFLRVKALHAAWMIVDEAVGTSTGRPIHVESTSRRLELTIGSVDDVNIESQASIREGQATAGK